MIAETVPVRDLRHGDELLDGGQLLRVVEPPAPAAAPGWWHLVLQPTDERYGGRFQRTLSAGFTVRRFRRAVGVAA